LRRLTANVVDPAAPLLLGAIPSEILAHSTIVRIDRACRGRRRCGRRRTRRCGRRRRPRRRRGRGRRGRRRGEWRGWDRRCRLWQSCSRATPANSHAAIVLLCLRPRHLDHVVSPTESTSPVAPRAHLTGPAIVWQRRRRARQEPEQQGDEQKKTEKAATRDYAGEISPRSNHVEISSETHVLVRGLLNVVALSSPNIRQSAVAAASTSNTTCCAILSSPYSAGTAASTPGTTNEAATRTSGHAAVAPTCACHADGACPASTITGVHVTEPGAPSHDTA